jgi:transcription initiation factor TFIID TATA-box-binding protein
MQYEPEIYPGLQLRLDSEKPLITLYTSGSYTIVGAESHQELREVRSKLIELFIELDILAQKPDDDPFDVDNIVCVYDLGRELDLAQLAIGLGLENTEYEPEQSPFLVYRPKGLDLTMTIPSNGKLMITGLVLVERAYIAIKRL